MKRRSNGGQTVEFDPTISAPGNPIAITTSDFRFCAVSDRYCEILQRSREELLNCDWQTIVHRDDLADPKAMQSILLATGEPYDIQLRILRGDGRWLLGRFRCSRLERGGSLMPVIQGNANFELLPTDNPRSSLPAADPALAKYIQTVTSGLAKLAGDHRLLMLQHFLSMASLEAAELLHRDLVVNTDYPQWLS